MTKQIRALLDAKRGQPRRDLRRTRLNNPFKLIELKAAGGAVGMAMQAITRHSKSSSSVYMVRCCDFVKIGYTKGAVGARVSELSVGSPFPLQLVAHFPGGPGLESELHWIFSEFRSQGEWFRVEGELAEMMNLVRLEEFKRWPIRKPRITTGESREEQGKRIAEEWWAETN